MRSAIAARRSFLVALGVVCALLAVPRFAAAATPVRIQIAKGSRQGAPSIDPRLEDVKPQLSKLAYVHWEVTGEHQASLDPGKSTSVALPEGGTLEVTLVEAKGSSLTFQVKGGRANSRLTISRGQRIVQQVTAEKDGAAYFGIIRPD